MTGSSRRGLLIFLICVFSAILLLRQAICPDSLLDTRRSVPCCFIWTATAVFSIVRPL